MQFDQQIIGAIKIKDALFIGDEFASKDLEFIVSNKVTHIINCSGKQVTNQYENFGVKYLTFHWSETDTQVDNQVINNKVLFDNRDQAVNDIYSFIEEASIQGESCLVHSVRGQSRACCALAAFFMKKYKWKLYKTLEFLNSRRPDLEIRASFFHQLTQLEQRLLKTGQGAYSSSWDPQLEQDLSLENDENLLRNTFQNAKSSPPAEIWVDRQQFQHYLRERNTKERKIQWADENRNGKNKSTTPQKKKPQISPSSGTKPILRLTNNNIKGKSTQQLNDNKTQINQQLTNSKIDNINGNIIHLTVNNYLAVDYQKIFKKTLLQPNQPVPVVPLQIVTNETKLNNFMDVSDDGNQKKGPEQNRTAQKRDETQDMDLRAALVPQNHTAYRRQNDSLKKHMDEKKQQSPYSVSITSTKQKGFNQPAPKRDGYQVKAIPAKQFVQNDQIDRPNSANVQKQDTSFTLQQKRPVTSTVNTRQFSPVVKGNGGSKQNMIITNFSKTKQGLRYPSPGQGRPEDIFTQSIIYGKPSWK